MRLRRILSVVFAALVVIGAFAGPAAARPTGDAGAERQDAGAERRDATAGKVLIISAPRLTWERLREVEPPAIMGLLERSAIGSTSVRAAASVTRPADAYLTIGAGNRMAVLPSAAAGEVLELNETMWGREPAEVFRRNTGVVPDDPIVSLSKPQLDRFNEREYFFDARSGSLAGALNDDGRSMAVIGNADTSMFESYRREAGLAAMDRTGQVDDGAVGKELLRAEALAPFGLQLDPEVVEAVFDRVWPTSDVVLVELSDLERAELARDTSTEEQGDVLYETALRWSDAMVASMLERVDLERDTVLLLGPDAPTQRTELTVFAAAGAGFEPGWARSSTTRRDRFVTLTDVAPTILDRWGIEAPSGMNDTRIVSIRSDEPLDDRIDRLVRDSKEAVLRDSTFGPISVVFVIALVLTILASVLCLARFRNLNRTLYRLTLLELAFLPTTYLLGMFGIRTTGALVGGLLGGTLLVALLAWTLSRVDTRLPALALVLLLWVVLAVDIATGGRLQINTTFGYSPIVAGRFAGFGNQAYSMFAITFLIGASAFADRRATDDRGRATFPTCAAVVVWTLVSLVLDGHPAMGSDVGGVLSIVPAAIVFVLLLRQVRIDLKLLVGIGVVTVAILAAFAAIDLGRPPESRTHLGRFVIELFDGGAGTIIRRKIAANLRVLTSVWAWVIPAALGYFCYIVWRPNRTFARLLDRHPTYRSFGIAALTLGVMAMAVNDSGVSLPAIMVAIVSAYTINLVMDMEHAEGLRTRREYTDG